VYLNDSVRKKGVAEVFKMCYDISRTSKYNMRAKKQKKLNFYFQVRAKA